MVSVKVLGHIYLQIENFFVENPLDFRSWNIWTSLQFWLFCITVLGEVGGDSILSSLEKLNGNKGILSNNHWSHYNNANINPNYSF